MDVQFFFWGGGGGGGGGEHVYICAIHFNELIKSSRGFWEHAPQDKKIEISETSIVGVIFYHYFKKCTGKGSITDNVHPTSYFQVTGFL